MQRVRITGMSGTGKSVLLDELARRGHQTVETDYDGYTGRVDGEWLWDESRIDKLLSRESDGVLFVQGTVRNQVNFYHRFDHIVLLSAPPELMVERLAARTTNPYGKRADELAEVLENLSDVEPLLRHAACLELVTTLPVPVVADRVLQHVTG